MGKCRRYAGEEVLFSFCPDSRVLFSRLKYTVVLVLVNVKERKKRTRYENGSSKKPAESKGKREGAVCCCRLERRQFVRSGGVNRAGTVK